MDVKCTKGKDHFKLKFLVDTIDTDWNRFLYLLRNLYKFQRQFWEHTFLLSEEFSSYEIITFLLSISGTSLMAFSFITKIGPHPHPRPCQCLSQGICIQLHPVVAELHCAGESFSITMTVQPAVWCCRWPWLHTSPLAFFPTAVATGQDPVCVNGGLFHHGKEMNKALWMQLG